MTSPATTLSPFDKGWVAPTSTSEVLEQIRGYTVNSAASETVDFGGTLGGGTVSQALTTSGGGQGQAGWHLLGNPYPAPLDWSKGSIPASMSGAVYVHSSTSRYSGIYRSYQNGVGGSLIIPVAQGFFVRTIGTAAFSLTNAVRVTTSDATALQRTTDETRPLVQLSPRGSAVPAQVGDAFVYFEQGATARLDARYDAEKLLDNGGLVPSPYSLAAGSQLSINGLPQLTTTTVPLHVTW